MLLTRPRSTCSQSVLFVSRQITDCVIAPSSVATRSLDAAARRCEAPARGRPSSAGGRVCGRWAQQAAPLHYGATLPCGPVCIRGGYARNQRDLAWVRVQPIDEAAGVEPLDEAEVEHLF